MFELRENSAAFRGDTEQWVTPIELNSETAQRYRRRAQQTRGAADDTDHEAVDSAIRNHLDAIESGDTDRWWHLNQDLLYDGRERDDPNREFQSDLTQCPGWKRADDPTRERIIAAARRYLDCAPPDPNGWFDTNRISRPAFAGYRALHLLAKQRPAELDALNADTWTIWMPIIVAYPRSSESEDERFDDVLNSLAAIHAAASLSEWTLRIIDVQNATGEGHLFVLWRLRGLLPTLADALAEKLEDAQLQPKAQGDLVTYGMRVAPQKFLPKISARLTADAVTRGRDTALEVASAALASAPGASWPVVLDVLQNDPTLGRDIFERVASGGTDLGSDLDDQALHRLLGWLLENFPAAEDPSSADGFIAPRVQAAHVRDRLLVVLAQRGTNQASAAIDDLATRYPSPGMTSLRSQAREARLARWTAPTPHQIIQLAQSSDARIVLSSEHLQQAVIASLHRIERRLQDTTPPSVRELWNTRGRPTPKHEEELSTWLRARLDEDLRVGGRVIGRELEIRANAAGRGRGESADISVFAPLGTHVEGAVTASLTIEVKGCWHRDVRTAMRIQLLDRYLTGTGTTHGIYLVFWFAADNWDPSDSRRRRCTDDPEELTQTLDDQARSITDEGHATVRSVLIDASLPPRAGPARRIRQLLRRVLSQSEGEAPSDSNSA